MEETGKKAPMDRTATEVLVDVLDDFSEAEGRKVIVVWTNEKDEVAVSSNVHRCEGIGMLAVANDILMRKFEKP